MKKFPQERRLCEILLAIPDLKLVQEATTLLLAIREESHLRELEAVSRGMEATLEIMEGEFFPRIKAQALRVKERIF